MPRALERAARERWLALALDTRFGLCDTCRRVRGEDGRLLLVAKQPRSRRYECLDCFDITPTRSEKGGENDV